MAIADRNHFRLMGYATMFLAPSLVLFLIGPHAVASVWLASWFVYLVFVVRYFRRFRRRGSRDLATICERWSIYGLTYSKYRIAVIAY